MPIQYLTTKPVTNLCDNLPILGRIYKGEPKTENKPGKELSYFRIEMEPAFRQYEKLAITFFGEQPVELRGAYLGAPETNDVLSAWLREWSTTGLVRECDGVTQNRAYNPNEGRVMPTNAPCLRDKGGCKCNEEGSLNIMFPAFSEQIKVLGAFRLTTHSSFDISEFYNRLMGIQTLYNTLWGIPLVLWRELGDVPYFDKKDKKRKTSKHYLVKIRVDEAYVEEMGVTNHLSPTSAIGQLPASTTNALPALTGNTSMVIQTDTPAVAPTLTWIGTNGNMNKILTWADLWFKMTPENVLEAFRFDDRNAQTLEAYTGDRLRIYASVIAWSANGNKSHITEICATPKCVPADIAPQVKALAEGFADAWLDASAYIDGEEFIQAEEIPQG